MSAVRSGSPALADALAYALAGPGVVRRETAQNLSFDERALALPHSITWKTHHIKQGRRIITVVFLHYTNGAVPDAIGVAIMNPEDQFNAALGKRIAKGRALKMAERETGGPGSINEFLAGLQA